MAALHTALECLKPVSIDELPTDNADLHSYIRDLLIQARWIVETLPEPLSLPSTASTSTGNSNNKTTAALRESSSNSAFDAVDMVALQKEWGKPFNRIDNVKENPMQIPVYKLKSKDGKGTWFARRSVHVGPLPFDKFKEKLQSELAETMRIRDEMGEGGSIRGVGSERRLERLSVPMQSAQTDAASGPENELGVIEVHHLAAHFPGPSTSRDFVTLLLSSDKALNVSCHTKEDRQDESFVPPRHFMIISKPCKHPDAPVRKGYIRGEYQSIEMIRELPVMADAESVSTAENKGNPNPVEWIMITRSDPGGNIPKWMVDKGTVPSIISDTKKFIDWAIQDEPESDNAEEKPFSSPQSLDDYGRQKEKGVQSNLQPGEQTRNVQSISGQTSSKERKYSVPEEDRDGADTMPAHMVGLAAGIMRGVSSTLASVAPKSLFDFIDLPGHAGQPGDKSTESHHSGPENDGDNLSEKSTSSEDGDHPSSRSSKASFASVHLHPRNPLQYSERGNSFIAQTIPPSPGIKNDNELAVPSMNGASSAGSSIRSLKQDMIPTNSHNKELTKLANRKAKIVKELEVNHEERDKFLSQISLESDTNSNGEIQESIPPPSESKKDSSSSRKNLATLERKEAKLSSQLHKIEAQQQKVMAKIESKRQKESEKNERDKLKAEVEKVRKEMARMKVEMDGLRKERLEWLSLVGRLQQENIQLAAQVQKAND
ncbi:hypothetical protein PRK78_000735 [Emydomyces testavorans]|uniref:DUF3074 domain-containing protein n=1 Tax=Emydomyces testavorans TaxID=2070801 RepID=A0AAF0DB85_9EURO|nr:hypothetical protein PRK78_000735 [Emydomyces testavorans]